MPVVQWLSAEGGASITEIDNHNNSALLKAATAPVSSAVAAGRGGGAFVTETTDHNNSALLLAAIYVSVAVAAGKGRGLGHGDKQNWPLCLVSSSQACVVS